MMIGRSSNSSQLRGGIHCLPDLQTNRGSCLADLSQYREPRDLDAKRYVASYARHVARDPKYRSPESPDTPVKSVKVYRVLHMLLNATEMGAGFNPEASVQVMEILRRVEVQLAAIVGSMVAPTERDAASHVSASAERARDQVGGVDPPVRPAEDACPSGDRGALPFAGRHRRGSPKRC